MFPMNYNRKMTAVSASFPNRSWTRIILHNHEISVLMLNFVVLSLFGRVFLVKKSDARDFTGIIYDTQISVALPTKTIINNDGWDFTQRMINMYCLFAMIDWWPRLHDR